MPMAVSTWPDCFRLTVSPLSVSSLTVSPVTVSQARAGKWPNCFEARRLRRVGGATKALPDKAAGTRELRVSEPALNPRFTAQLGIVLSPAVQETCNKLCYSGRNFVDRGLHSTLHSGLHRGLHRGLQWTSNA